MELLIDVATPPLRGERRGSASAMSQADGIRVIHLLGEPLDLISGRFLRFCSDRNKLINDIEDIHMYIYISVVPISLDIKDIWPTMTKGRSQASPYTDPIVTIAAIGSKLSIQLSLRSGQECRWMGVSISLERGDERIWAGIDIERPRISRRS